MSFAKCELSEYVSIGNGFDWSALIKDKSTGKSDRSRFLNSPVVTFFSEDSDISNAVGHCTNLSSLIYLTPWRTEMFHVNMGRMSQK